MNYVFYEQRCLLGQSRQTGTLDVVNVWGRDGRSVCCILPASMGQKSNRARVWGLRRGEVAVRKQQEQG